MEITRPPLARCRLNFRRRLRVHVVRKSDGHWYATCDDNQEQRTSCVTCDGIRFRRRTPHHHRHPRRPPHAHNCRKQHIEHHRHHSQRHPHQLINHSRPAQPLSSCQHRHQYYFIVFTTNATIIIVIIAIVNTDPKLRHNFRRPLGGAFFAGARTWPWDNFRRRSAPCDVCPPHD